MEVLEGNRLGVIDLKFDNTGERLAVSSLDSYIRVYDIKKEAKLIKEIETSPMSSFRI